MEKNNHIRINRLTQPVPEYRLDEVRAIMDYHDAPTLLMAMLKYMPEQNFRLMMEDLKHSIDVLMETRDIMEQGGLPGAGTLKVLVGKTPDQKLSPSECEKIGRIIAAMDGEPRRNYVGMINFLGAACRIHHEIKKSYINALQAQLSGTGSAESVPDVVYRLFPKEKMSQEEIRQKQEEEIQRLQALNRKGKAAQAAQEAQRAQEEAQERVPQPQEQPADRFAQIQRETQRAQEEAQERAPQPQEQPAEEPKEQPAAEQPVPAKKPTVKPKQPPKPAVRQYIPPVKIVQQPYRQQHITRMTRK